MLNRGEPTTANFRGQSYGYNTFDFGNGAFLIENHPMFTNEREELEMFNLKNFSNPLPHILALMVANALSEGINPNEDPTFALKYNMCVSCGKSGEELFVVNEKEFSFHVCPEHIAICDCCGKKEGGIIWSRNYSPSTKFICKKCLINYRKCRFCGELHLIDDLVSDSDGLELCPSCRKNKEICPRCGRFVDRGSYEDNSGFCSFCIRDLFREYDYIPKIVFHGKGEVFYGIELETDEYENTKKAVVELFELSENEDIFHMCKDGSLLAGIEIVFQPRTLRNWYKFQEYLQQVVDTVSEQGGKSFHTNTCGLHVHRSKKDLSEIDICKVITFLVRFKPECSKIAQRSSNSYCQYYYNDEVNDYVDKLKYVYKNKDTLHNEKYVVLNLQHRDTIEFRLFKGTLKVETILASIEFCDACCAFVKQQSMIRLINFDKRKLWADFVKFVKNNKYKNLFDLIERKELEQCV